MTRRLLRSLWAPVCVLLLVSTTLADYELGRMSLMQRAAPSLRTTGSLNRSLGAVRPIGRFVRRVGGVAFDALAQPADDLDVRTVRLRYDSESRDGKRLVVVINGLTSTADIYDWMLIPIASYANSDNTSCFTLFGDLDDRVDQSRVEGEGGRILNYAEPFKDTLLGLRLFQLDVLLLDGEFATELPKKDGEYVLGAGESAPNVDINRSMLDRYGAAARRLPATRNADYSSYVICDLFQDIRFKVDSGRLIVTGEPFYYFWRWNSEKEAEAVLVQELNNRGIIRPTDTVDDITRRINQMTQDQKDQLWDRIQCKYLAEFSRTHASLIPQLSRVNPTVWDAGRKTMRFAAFFRYCKTHHPDAWMSFVKEVTKAEVLPTVRTPTVLKLATD